MSDTEVKLNGCLFGGYEKRSTEAYIEELRTIIAKLEKDLQVSGDTNKEYAKKLDDAKSSYQELFRQNEEQGAVIRRQKKELEMDARVIEVQKEKTRARSDTVRQQEELLKEQEELLKKQDEELSILHEEIASLKDTVQADGEQMLEFERKLEQKVQILKEQEKTIAQLKSRIEKLQHMYEEAVQNQWGYLGSKLEQFIQEGMKIISGWKR